MEVRLNKQPDISGARISAWGNTRSTLRRQWAVPSGLQHRGEARPHADGPFGCSLMTAHIFRSLQPTVSLWPQLLNSSLQSRERQHGLKETKIPPTSLSTKWISSCGKWILAPSPGTNNRGLRSWKVEVWCLGQARLRLYASFLQKWVPAKSPVWCRACVSCAAEPTYAFHVKVTDRQMHSKWQSHF